MTEIKLKPCPFCGGSAEFSVKSHSSKGSCVGFEFVVRCSKCGICSPNLHYKLDIFLSVNGEIGTMVDERYTAVNDWNRRADNG